MTKKKGQYLKGGMTISPRKYNSGGFVVTDDKLQMLINNAKSELQWAKEHEDDEYMMGIYPEYVIDMARELIALREVAKAAKECEPYYRDPSEGYPYGPEALKLIKAIENWRKLREGE